MLENTPSEPDTRPLSSGPPFQWLGVQWQGARYAISLNSISAVFKSSPAPSSNASHFNLDVAVHEGGVVYMKAFENCFDISNSTWAPSANEATEWAMVLQSKGLSATGCRVQSVAGPFWAKAGLTSLEHDGQQWTVVHRSGDVHA
jgi:hypothetical protein